MPDLFPEDIEAMNHQLIEASVKLERLQAEYAAVKESYSKAIGPLKKQRKALAHAIGEAEKAG